MARIAPLNPPYAPDIQAAFDAIMPAGVDPLVLFRTLAVNTRVYGRFRAGGLLDRGLLTLRQREIVIDRTCALNGCEYEWGVHIAFFAAKVKFTPEQIAATVHRSNAEWAEDERGCSMSAKNWTPRGRSRMIRGRGSPAIFHAQRYSKSSPWSGSIEPCRSMPMH